ncbi:hypothetical protein AKJ52_01720 [candidate division MSBL1 archaeon SCGC-AAA382C18]|uniref:PAS domain-containing protein n=1 Tax=candidate division MSBL1 archaeon SCGC-AAA382C18 TaxID=1698281 RepID=A0A133VJW3_9EURY|nr:hypothetical protein AKJ52_01720 [candidate division MSBL1 archaeon SCGC-AAA382C18]
MVPHSNSPSRTSGKSEIYSDFLERYHGEKKTEERIKTEEERLDSLMDLSPDLLYFKDTEYRFTRVNQPI